MSEQDSGKKGRGERTGRKGKQRSKRLADPIKRERPGLGRGGSERPVRKTKIRAR